MGHNNDPQIEAQPISNQPDGIVSFCCGSEHSLFLDQEGSVYSVGYNGYGQLGLGHNENVNQLSKIPNMPPIRWISCGSYHSLMIDDQSNLWSFGNNEYGQLGMGDFNERNLPSLVDQFKNIQQLSHGFGFHSLVQDENGNIFGMGMNYKGQLGIGKSSPQN